MYVLTMPPVGSHETLLVGDHPLITSTFANVTLINKNNPVDARRRAAAVSPTDSTSITDCFVSRRKKGRKKMERSVKKTSKRERAMDPIRLARCT